MRQMPTTARLPTPLATGTLAKRPLAHLLVYAFHNKLTGTFEVIDTSGERAHIVLSTGTVVRVWTSTPVIFLGHLLYELGHIDSAQMSASLAAVAATKRLHGQILVANGVIDREQLSDGLRQQRARKLQHVFTFSPDATFSFYADVDRVGERPLDPPPSNPLPSVWRGIRAYPSWEHVRATMATVAGHPLHVTGPIDKCGLDDRERAIVERLRATPMPVSELVIRARVDARAADVLVYFLVIAKLVEVAEPLVAPPEAAVRPEVAAPTASAPVLRSGEYIRNMSFTMRAARVTGDHPLRIPSPTPGTLERATTPGPVGSPPRRDSASLPKVSVPEHPSAAHLHHDVVAHLGKAALHGAEKVAQQAIAEAETQFLLGERHRAVALVRKALTLAPGTPSALALLAYLEASGTAPGQEGYLRDLLRMADAALDKEPSCRRGRFYRAEIRKRLGDHEGALRDLRTAIRDDPDDVDAHRELNAYERKVREGTVILQSGAAGASGPRAGVVDWLRRTKSE